MDVAVLDRRDVLRLLTLEDCMDVVVDALMALARGEAAQVPPARLRQAGGGVLAASPACLREPAVLGARVVASWPGVHPTGGAVLLFDRDRGGLAAAVDAGAVAEVCAAAVSAVATRLLARQDACELALLGAGRRARAHLDAMVEVRPVSRVRLWSADGARAASFAEEASRRHGIPVEVRGDPGAAVEGADLVCAATPRGAGALRGERLAPGVHVNVGAADASDGGADASDGAADASDGGAAGLHDTVLRRCRVFADGPAAAAGSEGPASLGALLLGEVRGRSSREDVTLFRGTSPAALDAAAAHRVWVRARAEAAAAGGRPDGRDRRTDPG